MTSIRAILALGRVGQLPTVWSNCLAGWWLNGGGNQEHLTLLFLGVTLLYLGGAFLHDAFDAEHDHQHQPTRPIPSGVISSRTVWRWGLAFMILGALSLLRFGLIPGGLGLGLIVVIILFNTVHRLLPFGPVLMGVGRLLVYLIAASSGTRPVSGWPLWCGIALAAYVAGLEYLARRRDRQPAASYWPAGLLAIPILLAALMDTGDYREPGLLLCAILLLWTLRCLRRVLWMPSPQPARAVSGLVAGIVLVDWLAVADAPRQVDAIFIGLFVLTLALQRLAEATAPPRTGTGAG